jgi:hypothetical protein
MPMLMKALCECGADQRKLGRCPRCGTQLSCIAWGSDYAILCYGPDVAGCSYAARLRWERLT